MRKVYLKVISVFVVMAVAISSLFAQTAASYNFSQSSGTYTPITGGTLYAAADNAVYGGTASLLPFSFSYLGTGYTSFRISTNGFITLGNATTPSTSNYTPLSGSAASLNNCISALGCDLYSTPRYEVLGTSPSRVAVIQWSGVYRYSPGPSTSENLSFQIRLYETSNKIEIVYSPTTVATSTTAVGQVGIKGASNADVNNVSFTNATLTGYPYTRNWNNLITASSNTDAVVIGTGLSPASGTTLTWTPSSCAQPTVSATATVLSSTGFTANWTNSATYASGYNVRWRKVDELPTVASWATPTTVAAGSSSYAITGLSPSTYYIYSVEGICSGSSQSNFSKVSTANSTNVAGLVQTSAALPTITSFTPSTNLCFGGRQTVTITGTNFTGATGVKFNGVNAASYTVVSATSITAVTPASLTAGVITVTNSAGSATSSAYNVDPGPTVTATASASQYCGYGSIRLEGTGGTTYKWSPVTELYLDSAGTTAYTAGTASTVVYAKPTTSRTYIDTGFTSGCSDTGRVALTLGKKVTISSVTAQSPSACAGGTIDINVVASAPAPVSSYAFTGGTSTYSTITGTTLGSGAIGDDVGIGNLPIGFTFNYNGAPFTVFAARSNGLIELGNTTTTLSGFSSNALASNANCIAGLWDDNNTTGGSIIYATTGTAPNRVLTVQYTGMHVGGSGSSSNTTIDFQIKLYETSGKIELIYGNTSGSFTSTTASIGISGSGAVYQSVTPLSPASTSTVSSTTENTSISSATNFPSGTMYTFIPPSLTYAWTSLNPSNTLINNTVATATATVNATGKYQIVVSESGGCSALDSSLSIALGGGTPAITITPSTASTVCPSTSVTLTSGLTGGCSPFTYAWSNGATTANITVSPTTTTIYNVTVTDNTSATASATYTVNVFASPTPNISPATAAVCGTTPATLTASGGTSYKWSVSGSAAVTGLYTTSAASTAYTAAADQNPMYAKPTGSTTYTVTATDGNSCTATATATVNVYSALTATATADPTTACSGDTSRLNVTANMDLGYGVTAISSPASVSTSSLTPYAGVASLTGDDAVTSAQNIGFPFVFNGITYSNFCVSTNGNIQLGDGSGTTNNPLYSNAWTPATIPNTSVPNNFIALAWKDWTSVTAGEVNAYLSGTAPNRKLIVDFNDVGNYVGQIMLNETSNTIDIISVNIPANTCVQGIENATGSAGYAVPGRNNVSWSSTSISGYTFTQLNTAYTYNWSSPTAPTTISSTSVSNPKIDNFGGTETYTVTVTETTSGCAVTANITVTLSSTPLVLTSLTNSKPAYCIGDSSTLTVAVTGGCTPYTYTWSGGIATTASVKVKPTTTTSYSVTVTDKNGATVTATTTVTVNSLPLAAISPTTAVVCGATPATLTASGGTTYKWSVTSSSAVTGLYTTSAASTAYTAAADQNPMYVKPTATTSYTVTVTDANSCSATANTTVNVYSALTATATADPTTACSGDTSRLNVTPAMSLGYSTSSIAYAPISTPGTGVTTLCSGGTATLALTSGSLDDGYWNSITLPFTLSFNGSNYTTIGIGTNGVIGFGSLAVTGGYNNTLPSTSSANPSFAPFYVDFNNTAGSISYFTTGTTPNRKFVVNYTTVPYFSVGGSQTFQAVINEDGSFESHISPYNSTGNSGTKNVSVALIQSGTVAYIGRNNVANSTFAANEAWKFSPILGTYTYNWSNPTAPTTMSSTSVANPKIENFGGTETYTVTVTETTSGCAVTANATVTLSTTQLVFVGITNSNPSYCSGDSSLLVVSATGGCQPYTYAWSGGAGSTASVKVKPTVNTTYSVTVTDKNSATVTATTNVNVIAPQITATSVVGGNGATATTTTICGPSAVDLSATPSAGATIKWYDALTGGNLLATGNNYTTSAVVSATKNYYAQASISSGTSMNVARAVPAATSADYWTNYGLVFNTTSDIVLNSVVVYPSNSAPANMTIRLINSAGTQVSGTSDVTFMPISASGATPQTVNLGYSIPAGNNYKLIIVSGMSSSNELVQESSGYSYPITNGPVSITSNWNNGSTSTSYYDWFYNWDITTTCVSPRTTFTVNYTTPPALVFSPVSPATTCSNIALPVTVSGTGYTNYAWSTGANSASVSFNPSATTTYTVTATGSGCILSASYIVNVNNAPTVPSVGSSAATICAGQTVDLTSSTPNNTLTLNYSEGFESGLPTGWVVLNGSTTNPNVWTVPTTPSTTAHGGTKALEYMYNSSNAANTYAITSGFNLVAGNTYTIKYWENTGSFNERLKVTVGNAQTIAAQSTILQTLTGLSNTTYAQQTTTFTPSTTGTYYFGWNCYSAANRYYLDIDDIQITGTYSEPATYAWSSSPAGFTSALQNHTGVVTSATTAYTVTASYSNGCSATATINVTANPRPTGVISGTANICAGVAANISIALTGTGPWSITYTDGTTPVTVTATTSPKVIAVTPATATTYTISALSDANCSAITADMTGSATLTPSTNCTLTWNGTASTDWNDAANWSQPLVPNSCATDVVIPAGTPNEPIISSADIQVGDVTIGNGVDITLQNSYRLKVCGDWSAGNATNATVVGGITEFNGTSAQTISGNTQFDILRLNNSTGAALTGTASINTRVELPSGNFNSSAGRLIFLSTSDSHCATIDLTSASTGAIIGNIETQRFVPVAGNNQHYFSSPVNSVSFAQYGASGSAGYVVPQPTCDETQLAIGSPYGTVFQYHEDAVTACSLEGWEVKTSGNAQNAKGYSIYKNGGAAFSLTGPANQAATITTSGYTNSGWSNTTLQGRVVNSGWSLVGNPYLSTVNLDGTHPDFDAQAQVWHTSGPYTGTYQPVMMGGGSAFIPPHQGFMIHKTVVGGTASFDVTRSECVNSTATFYRQAVLEGKLGIKVSGNNYNDYTTVQFNSDASATFDPMLDANKLEGNFTQPYIASEVGNVRYSINSLKDIASTSTVPVVFKPGVNGTYTLSFDDITTFDPTVYIFLEDKKTGAAWLNLRTNATYTFASTTADNINRFVLHFTPPTTIVAKDATCAVAGKIDVSQVGTSNWNATVKDNQGNVVAQGVVNSSATLTVNPAAIGNYTVTLIDANGYTAVRNITVNGVAQADANFNVSTSVSSINQSIAFSTNSNSANTYVWNFGDGNTANVANTAHTYSQVGTFNAVLTVTTPDGCVATSSRAITVLGASGVETIDKDNVNVYAFENKVIVKLLDNKFVGANVQVFNLLGQEILKDKLDNNEWSAIVENVQAAFVVVTISNKQGESYSKKVLITNK